MTVWRRLPRPFRYLGCAILVAAAFSLAMANARAEGVTVNLDHARIVKLPANVATIVIGNPLIADGTLQPGGLLVVTGKGYGTTNMVALDRKGQVVLDREVTVTGPHANDVVVVYKGVDRESYSCTPDCGPRVGTLGDAPPFFAATLGETSTRNGQAAAGNGK
ncbi:MAG: hypothetical protein OJF62_002251 [Pseudolabrys sp.]|jgi:hypothetical protein|nr:hypothetical protein [Pseudolabrys sp.]